MQFDPSASVGENFIPLCVPQICGNEWAYLKECLDTGWVSSVGSFVDRFEQELASHVAAKYGVAVVNGTAALHIALVVAGVQPDDEVLVSTLTFIAPANAIRYVGAWPVFIDAEPDYWQIDPEKVTHFLTRECRWTNGQLRNKLTGRKVSAILPVHILGHPADMDPIFEIAHKYELAVIEDATESLGAKYKNTMVGRLGEIACFSFNGNKIITTGGGGMIVTENATWAQRARYLSTQAKDDPVESIHKEMGYNYRLTNIQAALGCAQLEHLDGFIGSKRKIAEDYSNMLSQCPGISPMQEASWAHSIFWLYTILVDEEKYGLDSRMLLHKLSKDGIQTRPLWQPLHRSPVYRNCQAYHCDSAEKLYRQALSLPCSVGLSEVQQSKVLNMIRTTSSND
jgi:perosamine synthetase